MMKHKGYTGEVWIDLDAEVLRGRVVGIRDIVTFQAEQGEEPNRPDTAQVEGGLVRGASRLG